MKVYISSTYMDLQEYRTAVADVLRQMGHEPKLMETYVSEDKRPLEKCLEDIEDADIYIGIFAWRYGYVPPRSKGRTKGLPPRVAVGKTSITECEYRRAQQRGIPCLIFLAGDAAPWNPQHIDALTGPSEAAARIKALRDEVRQQRLVSFFSSPSELASLVGTSVYRAEVERQLTLLSLREGTDLHPMLMGPQVEGPHPLNDSTLLAISSTIQQVDDRALIKVDLGNGRNWWSTRLFFLASLSADLTDVRQLVFIDSKKRLFGIATPESVRDCLVHRHGVLRQFEVDIGKASQQALNKEVDRRGNIWYGTMQAAGGENNVKVWVRKQDLRRWIGDGLLEGRVKWPEDEASQVQVARQLDKILSWPQTLVPIEKNSVFFSLVDRVALSEEIARRFIRDRLGQA